MLLLSLGIGSLAYYWNQPRSDWTVTSADELIGIWRSLDDPQVTRRFLSDGTCWFERAKPLPITTKYGTYRLTDAGQLEITFTGEPPVTWAATRYDRALELRSPGGSVQGYVLATPEVRSPPP